VKKLHIALERRRIIVEGLLSACGIAAGDRGRDDPGDLLGFRGGEGLGLSLVVPDRQRKASIRVTTSPKAARMADLIPIRTERMG
jgi:hypothetical protein